METLTCLNYHIVFVTKYRNPTIDTNTDQELHNYAAGIINNHNGRALEINGTADHIHILCGILAATNVSDMVRLIKSNSSKWMNEQAERSTRFEWQTGYAAFTVSYSNIEAVRKYIQNQKLHHAKRSFHDEYILLLEKHGITFDRKHLFDDEHVG